ncbi:DUF6531 domain-containing protein [Streptomyces sp. NPDC002853]
MAGNRPADWHVLDLDKDPTPGDPHRVRNLAKNLHDFADDVSKVLRDIKGMAGEDAILTWAGKTAESFTAEFEDAPGKLKKLKKSYEMAGDALSSYWPELERSQALADKALAQGREAQTSLSAAQSRLTSADSWVDRAGKEADKYKDDDGGSKAGKDVPKPDPDKVKAATRNANSAEKAQTAAKSDVSAAKSHLDAAKKMAEDARKMRENAAGTAKKKLEEASDAGIQNRKWWEEVGDWVTDNWDTIVAVCKVVVAVLGVIAMIIGGPILGAIVLIAALVVLADTLHKYANGEAGLLDVAFAALDCIPGMKGLTSLRGLAKGMKGLKSGLKGLALGAKGLGKGARQGARSIKKLFTCGDPVDVSTGEMVMSATDVSLPGVLPLVLERNHRSSLRSGRFFGPSWSSTLDQRLLLDATGVRFIADDGMVLHYPVPDAGLPVLPVEGPRWPLEWDGSQDGWITVGRPDTGLTLRFRPLNGGASAELPLSEIRDRNDNTVRITYDREGMPVEVTHHGGYRIGVATEAGRVTALTLTSAADQPTLVRYAYDDRGNLAEIYNSSGVPLRFTYDAHHRITGWDDRIGSWYRYTYDDAGRCVASRGIDGILDYTYAYDEANRTTTATNSLGHRTRYKFNDAFQLVEETDPLGHLTARTWDRYDALLTQTDPLGQVTEFEYDDFGRTTSLRLPDGSLTATEYGALGLPERMVEDDGAVWLQRYDGGGNLVEAVDPSGAVTHFTYSEHGGLSSHTDADGHVRTLTSDLAGLPLSLTDSQGATTACVRDAFGRVAELVDPSGQRTRMGFTIEGRPTFHEHADGSRETWEWDAEGNELAHHDPFQGTTQHEIGAFDLPASRRNPDGSVHRYVYDTEQRLIAVTSPGGRSWTYDFDAAGRLVAESDFDDVTRKYSYDASGRLTRRENGAGEAVDFTLDAVGNIVGRHTPDGEVSTYRYNAAGQVTWARNASAVVALERDPLGRIIKETVNGRSVVSRYDALGRRTERGTPSGAVSRWAYDTESRPTSLAVGPHALLFRYDSVGREVERSLGTGALLAQSWQPGHHLKEQSLLRTAGHGHLTNAGDRGADVLERRRYAYASGGLLSSVDELRTGTRDYTLDGAGRVTAVDGPSWHERYGYDAMGNIAAAATGTSPAVEPDVRETRGTLVKRTGRSTYEHDAEGRVVRRIRRTLSGLRKIWSYGWNAENRLVAVETPEGEHWTYEYDPLGRRIAKRNTSGGENPDDHVLFVWDGENLAEESSAISGETRTWEYEPDSHTAVFQIDQNPSQDAYDEEFYAIVANSVGTPTELVSPNGEIRWRNNTYLWGGPAGTAPAEVSCPLRFPGQYLDAETQWHYNFARYYDPESVQYTSPDPLGLTPQDNNHGFVLNPLAWLDVLGLAPCAKTLARKAWQLRNSQGGYLVYHGLDANQNIIYAGITNNLARREAQHIAKNYGITQLVQVPGAAGLKKWQARAIEQGLIHDVRASGFSRSKNGVPIGQINSISPKRSHFNAALRWGRIFMS